MIVLSCDGSYESFKAEIEEGFASVPKSCVLEDGTEIPFTLSVGTASSQEFPDKSWGWQELFDAADGRMYAMKETHHAQAALAG